MLVFVYIYLSTLDLGPIFLLGGETNMPTRTGAFGLHLRPRRILRLDKVPVRDWNWQPADPRGAMFASDTLPKESDDAAWTNYRPSKRRQRVVLVFESGLMSPGIVSALRRRHLKFFYLDFLAFMRQGEVVFRTGPGSYLRVGPARLIFDDVAAVIWSQPMAIASRTSTKSASRHLGGQRWMQVLRELRGLCASDTLWLPSHPLNGSNDWQDKLRECRLAADTNLSVPEVLLTNSPVEARGFIRKWGGAVIFKEFSQARMRFETKFVSAKDPRLENIRYSPCAFQQFIEKEFDVRAVVIGDEVFAVRINSQASTSARLDWRVYDNARVSWVRMRLPRVLERSMIALMRRLDLRWASFDLVKSTSGNYYFLEVNRPGAVYWLKPFVGLDVAEEIARYLRARL